MIYRIKATYLRTLSISGCCTTGWLVKGKILISLGCTKKLKHKCCIITPNHIELFNNNSMVDWYIEYPYMRFYVS